MIEQEMTHIHKPGPGPGGANGGIVVNGGMPSRMVHRRQRLSIIMLKFVIGFFSGLLLTRQLQSFIVPAEDCTRLKSTVPESQALTRKHQVAGVEVSSDSGEGTKEKQLLLVGVMTADVYIETRARAVYETWGQKVPGKILFFTADGESLPAGLPVIRLKGVDDSYPPQKKSFMMLKYMKDNYGDQFEWFMRADDDVFVKTDRLELFLRNINSSQPLFIGQAGKGIQEEFGLLSLEYDENFCMGGPGIIFSHVTLSLVAPHVKDCLKNLYTTHEDVELGRCVRKHAGVPCTWSYEMQNIFYHNSSGHMAFTGPLKSREVHRTITLHPVKQYSHMYRVNNYVQGLTIQDLISKSLQVRREMASSVGQLRKRLGPQWNESSITDLNSLGLDPSLNKFLPRNEDQILLWNFISRAVYTYDSTNPRRRIDLALREGIEDVIREVMEGINTLSKERGRIIDFKEVLYGYYRVNPKFGVDYILDMLLTYKKYRGRKMTFPVRRHAYLQQPFGPLVTRIHSSSSTDEQLINLIVPLAGRLQVFERFWANFERVCLQTGQQVAMVIVLFPTFADDDPKEQIKHLVESSSPKYVNRVEIIEREERFARAVALQVGAESCADNCLLFFVDVDMIFDEDTLRRIRQHTISNRQMYFPIVFSQFDPSFATPMQRGPTIGGNNNHFDICQQKGYWRAYGFGIVSLYRSDMIAVGGMNVSIHGWGNEDVDFFDRVVRSNFSIFRAPDPGLVHIFHTVQCDSNLEAKQYEMCLGTRANTYASQRSLASYWIENGSRRHDWS